jgi:hypothetical protein
MFIEWVTPATGQNHGLSREVATTAPYESGTGDQMVSDLRELLLTNSEPIYGGWISDLFQVN